MPGKNGNPGHIPVAGNRVSGTRHGSGIRLTQAILFALMRLAPVAEVAFRFAGDAVHHRHRFDRIFSSRCFTGKHDRIRPIENGVGHIRGFGTGRERIGNHRLEHLGGSDNQLGPGIGGMDNALLHDRHALGRHLDTQVAARNHHPIDGIQNIIEIIERFGAFELGNHQRQGLVHRQQPLDRMAHVDDILNRTHKRNRNGIDALLQAEGQVRFILLGKTGDAQAHTGQVDALVRGQGATHHHPRENQPPFGRDNHQDQAAIIEQEPVASVNRFEQFRESDRDFLLIALRRGIILAIHAHQLIKG